MLNQFYTQNKVLLTTTGSIATICGLFLNISLPEVDKPRAALENIQMFSLILLIVSLILIFIQITKHVWGTEKELNAKDASIPKGIFTITLGYIFTWLCFNLLQYLTSTYPTSSLFIGFSLILGLPISLMTLMEYKKESFGRFSKSVIFSFSLSLLITLFIAALQLAIFKWFSFVLAYLLFPSLFVILFIVSMFLLLRRNKSVFKVVN